MMNIKKGEYMQKVIQDILQYLEQYFVYLYQGFVTIFIYSFTKAKGFKLIEILPLKFLTKF